MAEITGFTAGRMKVIEDTTVVDGDIVGTDLVLRQRNGTAINAGRVTGDVGPRGPVGPAGKDATFGGYTEPITNFSSVSGTVVLDFAVRNVWRINPTGGIIIQFANIPPAGQIASGTLWVANSNHSITWPSGTLFPKGEPPELAGMTFLSIFVEQSAKIVGTSWNGVAT